MDLIKYNNKLMLPKLRNQQHPQPQRKNYDNYESHGIAMDQWERDLSLYDKMRPALLKDYNEESVRLNELFMYDLMDEFNWLFLVICGKLVMVLNKIF